MTVEEFITNIRLTVQDCGYDAQIKDEMIRDALVFGMSNEKVRFKCMSRGNDLTLMDAIKIARTEENTSQQVKAMSPESQSVHYVKSKSKPAYHVKSTTHKRSSEKPHNEYLSNGKGQGQYKPNTESQYRSKAATSQTCPYCAQSWHHRSKCPASNQKCNNCSKLGHFGKVCKAKKIHQLDSGETVADVNGLFIGHVQIDSLHSEKDKRTEVVTSIPVVTKPYHKRYTNVMFKVDTGAQTNVLPHSTFCELFPDRKLEPPTVKLTAYGGSDIPNLGTCTMFLKKDNKKRKATFNVTDTHGPAMLGLQSCLDLGLVKINCAINSTKLKGQQVHKPQSSKPLTKDYLLNEHKDVFTGIGQFPGEPYHIQLVPNSETVINPPRSVSVHLQDEFKQELQKMEDMGIISHVTEPTEWVNAFVIVKKGEGKGLRICLDLRELNKNIKREHYYTQTIDDIIPKVANATHFSVLDARSGYWMVELDKESSLLTTFATPFGRFRYNRLPFGIVVSQDVFQRKMDEVFSDLQGITGIADDTFVYGSSEEEHDKNLLRRLDRARTKNIKFNPTKLQLKVKETTFFGHIWTKQGLKPDPGKVSDIVDMQPPQCKEDLQSFLGMVNYLNRYSPKLATISAPLRDLVKKNVIFIWNPEHQRSFEAVKQEITQVPVLTYYDTEKPNCIQCDASSRGLGAVLMQDGHPVCYASRSLTETEQRYCNIERELLAVVWSLEKFSYYVYRKKVCLQTDHKPLEIICKKSISKSSPRLQRMLLRMSKYDVDVEYIPGKTNVVADALSRVSPPHKDIQPDDMPEIDIHYITSGIHASPITLERIREHTEKDLTMRLLKQTIYEGWPDQKSECRPELREYWLMREDLGVEDGLIFKCQRLVIPPVLRKNAISVIHQGHMGIDKCLLRARQSMYWPRINSDIKDIIATCNTCQRHQNKQQSEPLLNHDTPQYPWQKIGTDIFTFREDHYLLLVDYHSHFPVVRELGKSMLAQSIVAHTKSVISEYGIPEVIISDNGPQYSSELYQKFCHVYGITHRTSSPTYPQSNGQAERSIQTVKRLLLKALESGDDPNVALLNYRSTPFAYNIPSPAEMLHGRKIRTMLHSGRKNYKKNQDVYDSEDVKVLLDAKKIQQKYYFDKHASPAPLRNLHRGDTVNVYSDQSKLWEPAVIKSQDSNPRSYVIQTDGGGTYRRNRKFLRPQSVSQTSTQDDNVDITDCSDGQNIVAPQDTQDSEQIVDNEQETVLESRPYMTRHGLCVKPPIRMDL